MTRPLNLSGLWTELGGTWMPLTLGPFPEPQAFLAALNTGAPALIGGPHVPVRGQSLAVEGDLLRIEGDVLRPSLRVVDVTVPLQLRLTYEGFVSLPSANVRRALQDFDLLDATLACSSRPDLRDGAHLTWESQATVWVPRAAVGGDPAPLMRLLIAHTRKACWDAWQVRTQTEIQAEIQAAVDA